MNFNTLQYFLDIVDRGSFTKAAEKNFVAQTALSHSMSKLEKEVGSQLLVRNRGKVSMTKAGELFYAECKKILTIHKNTLRKIEELNSGKKNICIGFIDIYECVNFKELQKRLEEKFPQYEVHWVDRYSVSEEELDIVIAYSGEQKVRGWEKKLSVRLKGDKISCLVSVENDLASKDTITGKDFKNQTVIVLLRDRKIDVKKIEKDARIHFAKGAPCELRYVYSALERRALVESNAGITLFEKNLFRYDTTLCREITFDDNVTFYYDISYKEECIHPVASEIKAFLEA